MLGGLDSERGKIGDDQNEGKEGFGGANVSPPGREPRSQILRRGAGGLRPRFRRNDVENSSSPTKAAKNKKKGGPIKVDEETKGMMKGYEEKLEDLRKQSF